MQGMAEIKQAVSGHPYIAALGGVAVCSVIFCIAFTGQVFGAFINQFAPCPDSPGGSLHCYAVYDLGIALVAVIAGLLCTGVLVYGFFRHRFYAGTSGKVLALLAALVAIGVAIPKLTVHDAVPLTDADRACTDYMFRSATQDRMLDRVALMLGKERVVADRGPHKFGGEVYTLFRIPLGWLHGRADESLAITCDYTPPTAALPVRDADTLVR